MQQFKTIEELINYSQELKNKKLVDVFQDKAFFTKIQQNKGLQGQLLEKYFGHKNNNKSEPDFSELGIELKMTSVIPSQKFKYIKKERLILADIKYFEIINEQFETSALMSKIKNMLIIWYVDFLKKERKKNYFIEIQFFQFLKLKKEIKQIIKNDFEIIKNKIASGMAHELSDKDTKYLGATTKGQNNKSLIKQPFSKELAMRRAFSFKYNLMNYLLEQLGYRNKIK